MKILNIVAVAISCSLGSIALGWNYTVHNNTPYHMIVSFERIGLFDNPVTMTPNSSTTVDSFIGWIDYCYAGAHLLIQPATGQKVPQVLYNGRPLALSASKMPNAQALNTLAANMTSGGDIAGGIGATVGGFLGGLAGGAALGAATVSPIGGAVGFVAGAAAGATLTGASGDAIGTTIGLLGSLTTVSENEVTYTAPYLAITPGFDACWNRTITLNYNASNNQLTASIE
jgi:hypothetical protein